MPDIMLGTGNMKTNDSVCDHVIPAPKYSISPPSSAVPWDLVRCLNRRG